MKYLVLAFITFLAVINIKAQFTLDQEELIIPAELQMQVKLLVEFNARFNYQTDPAGNDINEEFSSKISRDNYIFLLFNQEDSRIKSFDATYIQTIEGFINKVCDSINPYYIQHDNTLFARAVCDITYKKKISEMDILLQYLVYPNAVAEWVFAGANADFLDFNFINDETVSIRPTSHEVNFIELGEAFNNVTKIINYTAPGYRFDILSVLLYKVNNGDIKHDHVKELEFYYAGIPGYIMKIKDFKRNTMNSGWLIDDLIETDDYKKYLSNNLDVTYFGSHAELKGEHNLIHFKPRDEYNAIERISALTQAMSLLYTIQFTDEGNQKEPALFSTQELYEAVKDIKDIDNSEGVDPEQALQYIKKTGLTITNASIDKYFKIEDFKDIITRFYINPYGRAYSVKEALSKDHPVIVILNKPIDNAGNIVYDDKSFVYCFLITGYNDSSNTFDVMLPSLMSVAEVVKIDQVTLVENIYWAFEIW